jgi:transposase-like protein
MALEKLYNVKEVAAYFGVTDTTVLRWIKQYNDTDGKEGLRAGLVNAQYRCRESWIKDYAKNIYSEAKK